MSSLIKDIICFANTSHDENCYLIFGISDDLQITGMRQPRKKQANIINAIENLHFAGDNYPKISVETNFYNGIEIDILIIYNTDKTPIYLKKLMEKCMRDVFICDLKTKTLPITAMQIYQT